MKIAFLYPLWHDFPTAYVDKAMDVVGSELPRHLAARGHQVSLYTWVGSPHSRLEAWRGSTLRRDGVDYRRLPRIAERVARATVAARLQLRPILGPPPPDWYPPGAALFHQAGYGLAAAADSRFRRPDILHICVFDELVPLVRRLVPKCKVVLHVHDHKQAHRTSALTRRRLADVDAIVGVSRFSTDAVRRRFPDLGDRCHTIWNAVDVAGAPPTGGARKPKRLLYSGRLSPEKGVHTILDAFPLVLSAHPDAELVIVGPDSIPSLENADPSGRDPRLAGLRHWYGDNDGYARHLRAKVPEEARSRIRFVGPVDHGAIGAYAEAADLILFPSIWDEPFGLPVAEGMARGKPVVATRAGAFPETVEDGVTGVLVPPGDVAALASAIVGLLGDPRALAAMGRAARARATTLFSWNRCIDSWERLYGELLGEDSPHSAAPDLHLGAAAIAPRGRRGLVR